MQITQPSKAEVWVSTTDGSKKLTREADIVIQEVKDMKGSDFIRIGAAKTFQSIDGMGSSFESSTCFNLSKLDPAEREITFKALLTGYSGINLNLMRIFISMPDFKGDTWYSYCDLPKGETDTLLQKFSIAQDENYILPFLREALRIKPSPRFFASPWSPPTWMKTSGDLTGGRLKPEYYAAYARYCVKYIKAYEAAGIPVFAVTLQKEPRVNCEFDLYHFIDKITQ